MTTDRFDSTKVTLVARNLNLEEEPVAACSRCRQEMELHQPDINQPDRLLGICPDCGDWVMIDYESASLASVLELPRFVTVKRRPRLALAGVTRWSRQA